MGDLSQNATIFSKKAVAVNSQTALNSTDPGVVEDNLRWIVSTSKWWLANPKWSSRWPMPQEPETLEWRQSRIEKWSACLPFQTTR